MTTTPTTARAASDEAPSVTASPTFTSIGFDVYAEATDGRGVHAFARPAIGGTRLPALGVEDYVYVPFRRGDPAKFRGARPMLPADFPVSETTLTAIRAAVRKHLAALDRGEVSA